MCHPTGWGVLGREVGWLQYELLSSVFLHTRPILAVLYVFVIELVVYFRSRAVFLT